MKLQQTILALACLALAACFAEPAEPAGPRQIPQRVEGGNFTIYVSNQSFAIDPVDIDVYVDDTLVVVGDFEVGSQHSWYDFEFALTPGTHTLRAVTRAGKAELEETFEIAGKRYGVLDFWYYPDGETTPRQFSFDLYDQPPAFD